MSLKQTNSAATAATAATDLEKIEVSGCNTENENDVISFSEGIGMTNNNDGDNTICGTVLSPDEIRNKNRGKSDIVTLAQTIDARRENRMEVTFWEQKKFLDICLEISKQEKGKNGHDSVSRFSKESLERLIQELEERVAKRPKASRWYDKILNLIGLWDLNKSMLRLFKAGLVHTENSNEDEFYFRDFNFYYTVIVSRYSLMRIYPGVAILFWLLAFYFGSAVLFCGFMKNESICPTQETTLEGTDGYLHLEGGDGSYNYGGWMTSIYFASVTMSTVGYGDVSLYEDGQPNWITFIGILYMLLSVAIAFTVFASVATMSLGGIWQFNCFISLTEKMLESKEIPLYKQVRRLILIRVTELVIYFLGLNAIGIFVARFFVNRSEIEGQQWNWMTTIYWAIQTTTTIGYGDLDMPFHLRWFNIFFTTFGTAFVGSVFGSLAGLQSEVDNHRRTHAWKRREMSKMMVDELQINDDKLDQYEFVLGSLLVLQKVNTNDITQIMEKFHELAENKDYIHVSCVSEERKIEVGDSIRSRGLKRTEDYLIDFDTIIR